MRTPIIEQARRHHVAHCISSLYFASVHDSTWRGDGREGSYVFANGQGDDVALAWNADGVVALVFDHELPRREPLACLARLPAALAPLAAAAAELTGQLATNGLWADAAGLAASDSWGGSCSGIDMLKGFCLAAPDAFFGKALLQNWREAASISESQAHLAIRLADAGARAPYAVSPEDEVVLLGPPPDAAPATAAAATAVAEALAPAGILWAVPAARPACSRRSARSTSRCSTRRGGTTPSASGSCWRPARTRTAEPWTTSGRRPRRATRP